MSQTLILISVVVCTLDFRRMLLNFGNFLAPLCYAIRLCAIIIQIKAVDIDFGIKNRRS